MLVIDCDKMRTSAPVLNWLVNPDGLERLPEGLLGVSREFWSGFGILGLKYLTFDAAPISWDKLWLEVNRQELCNIAGLCSWS